MTKVVLTLFLIGHVLGDFYLQSSELAINKDESFKKLLKHSGIYMFSMMFVIIPVFSLKLLKWAFFVSTAHFTVDLVKFFILRNQLRIKLAKLVFWNTVFIPSFIVLIINLKN